MRSVGYGRTDRGSVRQSNEDLFLVEDAVGLYVVCDGMGGHAAGERAAEVAARTVRTVIRSGPMSTSSTTGGSARESLSALARRAVAEAAQAVFDEAADDPACEGMGTTVTLLLIAGSRATMAHVGNTRLYLRRQGVLSVLSEDHTWAAEAVERGDLDRSEEASSRFAHVLTRSVGPQPEVEVDCLGFDVQVGDRLLLCSDGLTAVLRSRSELAQHLASSDPPAIPQALIDLAHSRGAPDNVTALVVEIEADGR